MQRYKKFQTEHSKYFFNDFWELKDEPNQSISDKADLHILNINKS